MDNQKPRGRKRRSFTREFKAESMRLGRVGDRSIAQVSRDLDLTETALREWARRVGMDAGNGPPGALITQEREEPARVRQAIGEHIDESCNIERRHSTIGLLSPIECERRSISAAQAA